MKFWNKFLFLSVLILALTGCSKDDDDVVNNGDDKTTPVATYHSLDMTTDDGKVTLLQKHKQGKGIPIVIMGDGFVDKDIKEGTFHKATTSALESIFSMHPLKSLRDYFDVYEVTAVSYHASSAFWELADVSTFNTAFSVGVGEKLPQGAYVGQLHTGDENKIVQYAKKAIDANSIDNATIIMLVNDCLSGGITSYRTYRYTSDGYIDIPTGCGITYVSLEDIMQPYDGDISQTTFARLLLHEFGHGFAKLADEYIYTAREWDSSENGTYDLTLRQNSGYARNVSLESDVTKTYWADFAADSRYDFEKLGCYEGGNYQATGVYRPTENSIMNYTLDGAGFNVIGRVMIYKRCMNIAYGDSWKFDYEDFVKFDLEKAKAEHQAYLKQHPDYR